MLTPAQPWVLSGPVSLCPGPLYAILVSARFTRVSRSEVCPQHAEESGPCRRATTLSQVPDPQGRDRGWSGQRQMLGRNRSTRPELQKVRLGSPRWAAPHPVLSCSAVFVPASDANEVLVRWKRAGSYLLEELFEGNLEKECYEEICVYEEAREVFENDADTVRMYPP